MHFSAFIRKNVHLGKDTFKAAATTDEIKLENDELRALRKPKRGFGLKKTN